MPKAVTFDGGTYSSPAVLGNKQLKFGFTDTFDGSDVFSYTGAPKTVTITSTDPTANWNLGGDVAPIDGQTPTFENGVFSWTVNLVDMDNDGACVFAVFADTTGAKYTLSFG